ncbi:large conductance mechanosensitive channel protein MscL [Elizabethkingia anophelis]|uniref:Large-conductance mechanosensitive channel n=1 Tax=Elizabethkingia anophelis R26 TaxID=1246994 RepID=A0ABM6MRQ1_9FLAO|nr:large conductance mechanosensitive channel protein MscL [Elizabethkingia anophelis]ATC35823.1 large conductance mechanosensitive channel protein MscL [Elizabethkingia anophelis R26]ATC39461.1 large conductance mechanosensitive channel protein MscL [Elizabethkingia anophelis Ag1]ATC43140.1 large conductance mechanosensitive channel protein MscL [Elizabethkingia anophelis]ATC46816.1 large conductance mechanosensitive channel protein MscL [Elizabethkingia anophelis]ELR80576.1 large-conductance
MGFIKEFKEFAIKGNAFDLAVGVIIGAAFGKIVTSIIDDLIMPIVAAIVSKPDFSSIYFAIGKGSELIPKGATLAKAKEVAPDAAIFAYGNFITIAINFSLLAFVVFLMVKSINKLKSKQIEEPKTGISTTDSLLSEIRDELKRKQND